METAPATSDHGRCMEPGLAQAEGERGAAPNVPPNACVHRWAATEEQVRKALPKLKAADARIGWHAERAQPVAEKGSHQDGGVLPTLQKKQPDSVVDEARHSRGGRACLLEQEDQRNERRRSERLKGSVPHRRQQVVLMHTAVALQLLNATTILALPCIYQGGRCVYLAVAAGQQTADACPDQFVVPRRRQVDATRHVCT